MGLLAGVSGIAVIIGAWVITLNRKVRQQTITIRKQLETEAALEQFYQEILQKAQEGIWILNSDNRTSFINQKLCRLLETNEEELARKSFLDVVVKEDRAQAERMLREPLVQDLRLQGATGNELWALVSSTPFEMGKGNRAHCLLMFVDITSRKRAEAALEESESRYRALAENLETAVAERTSSLKKAIGDMEAFSYGISHDLRGPLRAMQGYSQILLEDHGKALSAEAQSYLERISKASQKLDRMIQDLLAYSRVASGEVRVAPVNVAGLVREILSEEPALRPFAECVELEQPLPALLAHGPSLRQVLVNLIGNAVKFKKEGEPPRIRLWAEQRNPLVRIHVQDQGIGIREQDRERIFSIFERADHRFEGTGIGLAIVKRSIEKMGGRVGLESTLGQGSDFWFELSPAATEGAEHPNKSFERS
jgi:PAS domain S-box-containing protein